MEWSGSAGGNVISCRSGNIVVYLFIYLFNSLASEIFINGDTPPLKTSFDLTLFFVHYQCH